jgi:diguanylate cyclase (GGDEF)-like protein
MWKNICFSSSMTQIAGASLAGIIYKLMNQADIFTISISFVVFAIAYLNYKQMISNINDSIEQAESAEKAKAELAKKQVEEAHAHAGQLELLLEKEEKISRDLRQSKKDLEYAAFHDDLTDLPNRAYLIERLHLLLQLGVEVSKRYYVLFVDLSRFKNINDSLGHTIGDEVLKVISLRLRRTLRDEDTIARLGGDEFAIILNDLHSIDEAKEYARKIYKKLTEPYMILGNRIFTDLHIGIAPFDNEQIKPEDVLRDADIAMHNAKQKNIGIAVFDKQVRSTYLEHIRLEGDLRYAIEKQEFEMYYQPLVSLKTGKLLGFEALLRWHHSELGFVSPGTFIPISEDSGLIIPITKWILQETCSQIAYWKNTSEENKDLLVSVNISGKHLADEGLVRDVKNALKVSDLSPRSLKLEITETTAMENADRTIEILNKLKCLGVQLSIDDFGTGYSSLSYLHKLPFDTLKIDRSFVNNATGKAEDVEILQTIVALTKNLKKEIIAEGIETEEQLRLLTKLGCDYGQGYLFAKPLPKNEMEKLLFQKSNWLPVTERDDLHKISPDLPIMDDNLPIF